MRVLILHDRYASALPNGENAVVTWEAEGLAARGVQLRLVETLSETFDLPQWQRGLQHLGGIYSFSARRTADREIREFHPDIVHVHNVWPHMTPSIYFACRAAKVPVVQTLHNYRLMCIGDFLCRDGKACELCLGKNFAWHGLRHRCVGGSTVASLVKLAAIGTHNALGTWNRSVDTFIAPSKYMQAKFVRGGVDERKIRIKPSCSPAFQLAERKRSYFCFAGRLSHEKGVQTLLDVWRDEKDLELRIAGAGPLETGVRKASAANPSIRYLGMLSHSGVVELMQGAFATLVPSTWDEPCPVTIVESFNAGTPVIASELGPRAEMVRHGTNGFVYPDGDLNALEKLISWTAAHPDDALEMGRAARRSFEELYSVERSVTQLVQIYEETLANVSRLRAAAALAEGIPR